MTFPNLEELSNFTVQEFLITPEFIFASSNPICSFELLEVIVIESNL